MKRALVFLTLSACSFDARLPEGVMVRCDRSSDCPPGLGCAIAAHRCVPTSQLDTTVPAVVAGSNLVDYASAPGSPVISPLALGIGGRARITFQSSKPIESPELTACAELTCQSPSSSGLSFTFECTAATTIAKLCPTSVTLRDEVGNVVPVDLRPVEIDTVAPEPPAVDVPGAVRFVRVPWGSAATDGGLALWLDLDAGAGEPQALLLSYGALNGGELARASLDDGGAAHLELPAPDRAEVYAALADRAGNVSATRRVRDVTWVATMGGKVPGDFLSNPHRFEALRVFTERAVRRDGLELGALDGVAERGGTQVSTPSGAFWRERSTAAPTATYRAATAWDSANGRLVLYGGVDLAGEVSSLTWEWTGDWKVHPPDDPEGDGAPPAMVDAKMAWDSLHQRVVLFGGLSGTRYNDETWLYNGESWARAAPATSPPGRASHALAYDRSHAQLVLFGGTTGATPLADTWLWDGTNWKRAQPASSPPARSGHAMVWDSANQRVLLFGGRGASAVLSDLWSWDGTSWAQVMPPTSPPGRSEPGFIFDDSRGRAFLYGGYSDSNSVIADAWTFADGGWQTFPMQAPGPRAGGVVAYDARRHGPLIYGGADAGSPNITWLWGETFFGQVWQKVSSPSAGPDVRTNHSMAYNTDTRTTVLAGGTTTLIANEVTYAFDGTRWIRGARLPEARLQPIFDYDPVGKQMLLFGGVGDDPIDSGTWVVPGDGTDAGSYVRVAPSGPKPRYLAGHAYDPVAGGIIMAGGTDYLIENSTLGIFTDEVWLWRNGSWRPRPPMPGANAGLGFVAQTLRDGGSKGGLGLPGAFDPAPMGSMWHLAADGGWSTTPALTSPPRLVRGQVAWDPIRERMLAFGPQPSSTDVYVAERLWEFDGTTWSLPPISDPENNGAPPARSGHAIAYDSDTAKLMLYGGGRNDLWEWQDVNTRPAHVFHLRTAAARAPLGAVASQLTFETVTGCEGSFFNLPLPGTVLLLFTDGSWKRVLHDVDAGLPALTTLTFSVTGPELQALLVSEPEVLLAVTPNGFSYSDPARVVTDYVEARLDYRLPP